MISCKTTFGGGISFRGTVSCNIGKEWSRFDENGSYGLHNDVYIKMVIIYKKGYFDQNSLNFKAISGIVFIQSS